LRFRFRDSLEAGSRIPYLHRRGRCGRTFTGYPTTRCASAGSTTRFRYFTGEEFFQHAFTHERSDLSHWRQRLGGRLELLLASACGWRMAPALGRCYLKGRSGTTANVILSAAGHNFRCILAWIGDFWCLILSALIAAFTVQPTLKSAS
jgi:hypothetical protein